MRTVKKIIRKAFKKLFKLCGLELIAIWSPNRHNAFFSHYYNRNTRRRLEHLASLPLSIPGSTVLEVGAGAGDHTDFFIDRGCVVTTSDARPQCLKILKSRYPKINVINFDLEKLPPHFHKTFEIVYCAGLLYHINNPEEAIRYLAKLSSETLIISTTVSYDANSSLEIFKENSDFELHSISGGACRPSRLWVFEQLKSHFPYVYMPTTQPNHLEFPIDWSNPGKESLPKAIFIGSRHPIYSEILVEEVLVKQSHH